MEGGHRGMEDGNEAEKGSMRGRRGRGKEGETACREAERWMDGRKESKRGYGNRDPTPLEAPAGQKPVTAAHCSASITTLQRTLT